MPGLELGIPVLDYSTGALATTSDRFDVILDAVNGAPTSELRRLLARPDVVRGRPAGRSAARGPS